MELIDKIKTCFRKEKTEVPETSTTPVVKESPPVVDLPYTVQPLTVEERMTQQEAMEVIKAEYPEFTKDAEQWVQDGQDLVEFLSWLESFY